MHAPPDLPIGCRRLALAKTWIIVPHRSHVLLPSREYLFALEGGHSKIKEPDIDAQENGPKDEEIQDRERERIDLAQHVDEGKGDHDQGPPAAG